MSYRLIAMDMDGTLLNSNSEISKRTKDALSLATDKGIYTVFATGRMLKSAINYANRLGLQRPIISCNGAIITDSKRNIIYNEPLDEDIVESILKIAYNNNVYCHFYSEDEIYTQKNPEMIEKFYNEGASKEERIDIFTYQDIDEVFKKKVNVYKFIFLEKNEEKLQRVKDELENLGALDISSSWENNIEVTKKGVSKGSSLDFLCKKLDIDKNEVIAIGDNNNDISMIAYAGLGIAMKNGTDEAKEASNLVTPSTNDQHGVAEIIEEYMLGGTI